MHKFIQIQQSHGIFFILSLSLPSLGWLGLCDIQMQVQRCEDETRSILSLMKESKIYWQVKRELLAAMVKGKTGSGLTIEDLQRGLSRGGSEDKLSGLISNCLQKSTRRVPIQRDPNPQIEPYRLRWSQMITKEFNNMASKILREEQYDEQDESVTYVYDSSSLLQFLSSIRPKGVPLVRDSEIFLFQTEVLRVSKYTQMKQKYAFLNQPENILGGDMDSDLKDREKRARRIVQGENIASEIQAFLCLGCTNGDRVSVYRRYFECFYEYSGKRVEFSLYQKIWKHMIKSDSKQILRDPVYFVFKEAILKIYQTFICDKQLGQMVRMRQLSPCETRLDKFAPIHCNLPSKSFANYIAPFCYTSTSPEEIYEVFRQIYANYLIMLNTVSSLPDSILSLCVLFEELLFSTQKKIVGKFEQLQIQPLKIVFPWMFYCFIGYVSTQQFFLILDRVIGSKSLELLPLYCVSILFKEKTAILEAKNQSEIQEILEESLQEDIFIETVREFFKYHL